MSKVAAMGESHSHYCITEIEKREIYRWVSLRSAVRLDVREFRTKELFSSFDGNSFGNVNTGATAVVTL